MKLPNVKYSFLFLSLLPTFLFSQNLTLPTDSFEVVLSKEIYFDFGKHHLKTEADSALQAIHLAFCQGET